MLQRLHVKPTDVEGVKELEDFADGLNEALVNLSVDTKAALDMWDVVDSFFYCAKPEQVRWCPLVSVGVCWCLLVSVGVR